ncbi:LysR family transcriptional regulator [Pseudooceanicola onchidii]|uniref:LysR family transcriptional regulator n=1 Tax=Pseudooceanicola onchidii TaxID=2562279 RepID=UPI0010A9EFFE|nr:LysR family transcriptional regulator [Pseudooceanicola onchidii]
MTLDQIRIFLTVAELCHVTRAAERLNMTQSAVSAAISALERRYDVRLFDRVGRGIVLTEAGVQFVQAARRVHAEADAAQSLLSTLTDEPRGRLRIWASQTIASYWITPRMIGMQRAWPKVEMSLHAGNSLEVSTAVLDGTADLGLVEDDVPAEGLVRQVVGHDELCLVMSRRHALARKPVLDAGDYRRTPWLLREPGSGTRRVTEQHLASMALTVADLPVLLQLPTNEAILAGVRDEEGLAMLSWRSARLARSSGLALRRVTWAPRPRRPFLALTDPRRARTGALTAFLARF